MDEPRRKRKRWIWLVVGLVLLCTATVVLSGLTPNEYSFLNRFHPQIRALRPNEGFIPAPYGKTFVYIFEGKNAAKVFEALDKELVGGRGYTRQDFGTEGYVWFIKEPTAEPYGAGYFSPEIVKDFAPSFVPPKTCMVYVIRERTWLENQVDAVKKFLHWD